MAFVNEFVAAEDKAKYDWQTMPKPGPVQEVGMRPPSYWTIDRERNVFLIRTYRGREEDSDLCHFLFWWRGTPMPLHIRQEISGPKSTNWHLIGYSPEFMEKYEAAAPALRDALRVYGFSGDPDFDSTPNDREVQFSF